jgi:hypothetical protein
LPKLNSIEELICDEDLEEYVLEHKATIMPRLAMINNVDVKITNMDIRRKHKRVNAMVNKLPQVANHY